MLYGISNGAALWGARLVFEQLAGVPAPKAAVVIEETDLTDRTNPMDRTDADLSREPRRWVARVDQRARELLSPWLPSAGQRPGWHQALGVVLLLPLLMAFRGFTGYFSNYFLT